MHLLSLTTPRCDYCIHVAHPVRVTTTCPSFLAERTFLKPGVGGMENVIGAVNRSGSVKRLVYTSSMAGTGGRGRG
jgi:nucleoside-diphosphate-sugar epimerase